MNIISKIDSTPGKVLFAGVPEGYEGAILGELARKARKTPKTPKTQGRIVFVARDDKRMEAVAASLDFFDRDAGAVRFPAWDCLPYDRVSPRSDILARRIDALTLMTMDKKDPPTTVITTIAALMQKIPSREVFTGRSLKVSVDKGLARDGLLDFLGRNGYGRSETVMEPGEYAIRGGIVDLFPPGFEDPLRLDFFGDDLEGIRSFDPFSQRSTGKQDGFALKPTSELTLDDDAISLFRTGFRAVFGAAAGDDPLYESISAGKNHAGMEHWLPLFYDRLVCLLDYLPGAIILFDHQLEAAGDARWELICDCFEARNSMKARGLAVSETSYNPLPTDRLYVSPEELAGLLAEHRVLQIQPFSAPDTGAGIIDAGGKPGRNFSAARSQPDANVFDHVKNYIDAVEKAGDRTVIAAYSTGSRDRLLNLLGEHGIAAKAFDGTWVDIGGDRLTVAVILDIEYGFSAPGLTLITEQDILGDRLHAPGRRKLRADNFIAEVSTLGAGDLVVHMEHGIGRYQELVTLDVAGIAHDCLAVEYDGGDKLFVPVENIEVLSRYGDDTGAGRLDRLGGAGWQARKSKLKQRIREMAEKLIEIAAARELRPGEIYDPSSGPYEEFCAGFPFSETEDQARAIGDVIDDLGSGRPMDRLICGDVGFGKTEVALRAAFITAMEGKQVAVVVPTTLLARQHLQVFEARYANFPIRVAQISRLVTPKNVKTVKAGLADGTIDIVIGTHALLAKDVKFSRLGLLVIDEEQHFGVAHKEKLKTMKTNVHVLTLTATPIPRTLQMALTGVRELSLIATPPVDRLAVRTFVLPYDPVIVKEAIQRELFRGGQVFYVCPRVADIAAVEHGLAELMPDLKMAVAHGRLSPTRLEDVMTAFYDGRFDLLLSTNIVESGLDLPSVNTIILHRADMFGLAQLYQLRGRIGRSKVRGYAYLTLPMGKVLTAQAQKRLEVMQALDFLGAGFMLASYDLDIRGAGNLLGEEQSGQIREVGIELYQQMLEEAVAHARAADGDEQLGDEQWSPQIDIGVPVLIPAYYVEDLGIRLGLYRRIATLGDRAEIDGFAAEIIDRFGSIPDEVENLLATVRIKQLCKEAGVEKVDAGPKGAVVTFRNNDFANLAGLVAFMTSHVGTAKLRPDHKLVFMRAWDETEERMKGVQYLLRELAQLAAQDS